MQFDMRERFSVKRVVMSVVFLFILAIFTAIYKLNWWENTAEDTSVRIAIASAPIILDSMHATDATSVRLLRLIGQGLVALDGGLQPKPALADAFSHENYRIYTLTWRSKYFSDRTLITPAFVKNFYETILNDETGSPLKGLYADIQNIELVKNGVKITLNKENPWFWEALSLPITKLDSKKLPVGSGAFELLSKNDQKLTLSRRKDGQRFTFIFSKDPMVRVLKLLRGEVDIIHNDLPEELVAYALEDANINVQSAPSASYTYMGMLLEDAPTADVRVRKALNYAIDRQAIMDKLLGGRARLANSLLQEEHPAFWADTSLVYNKSKSKQLLADAGYGDKNPLMLQLSITTNPFILRVAQIIQSQLEEVGVELEISSAEWGTFYGNVKKGNFDTYILTWVGNFNPDIYTSVFSSGKMPPKGANRGRYSSELMDGYLADMVAEVDAGKRRHLVQSVQKLQAEDMIYIPLWRRDHLALVRTSVKGYSLPKDGGFSGLVDVQTLR